MKQNITVDEKEIAHFTSMADAWWDPKGKFRPLHQLNPVRLRFMRDHITAHYGRIDGLSLLDIGSGGGLVCEPMARLGAQVTGIDATEKNIHIATHHAEQGGLQIDYRHMTAEALLEEGKQYDVVLALEIVEHVADVDVFLESVSALVKPGGLLFMSTMNRTLKSYALAIIGAEYVLRWLPRGTHSWKKFLKPAELVMPLEQHGIRAQEMAGIVFNPIQRDWMIHPTDLDVGYILVGKKAL